MVDTEEASCLHHHLATQDPEQHLPPEGPDAGQQRETAKWGDDHQHGHVSDRTEEAGLFEASQIAELEKHGQPSASASSSAETMSPTGEGQYSDFKVISFAEGDTENPDNWALGKKLYTLIVAIFFVLNSTVGSTLASGATQELSDYFHVTNQAQLVLPTSIFLVGYCVGPIAWGPLSETYGRRMVMFSAFLGFTAFTLGCALSPTYAAFVVFRLLCGIFGSCPISVLGGICADLFHDPIARGRAMSLFMGTTIVGPIVGPLVSGFISVITWRWSFWLGLIFAGVTWVLFIFMSETYGPIILYKRARKLRKQTGNPMIRAPIELNEKTPGYIITVVLYRPIKMFVSEAIVLSACVYTGFVYAIFYIFLQSYPIIYQRIYGFNAGEEGLAFIPIGIGSTCSVGVFLAWDAFHRRARARDAPWARREESHRLPLACVAGPCIVIGLFWTGWTARRNIHWIVPMVAGIPFGLGYLLIFISLLNYLTDAYEIYAASANAAGATSRSIFGAALPFAAKPMYRTLGVAWACSLLGFVSVAMCLIPFAFIRWGDYIRAHSKFGQELKRIKEEKQRQRLGQTAKSTEKREVEVTSPEEV